MTTSRLWQALETFSGVAPQYDWSQALGDQWAVAGALLRQTGDIAEELICPKSSENGCLRQIVKAPRGGIRAECGDLPRRCENMLLQHDQVKILALDVGKLFRAIVRAFDLQDAPTNATPGVSVNRLGRYEIRAGVGFPLYLGFSNRCEALTFRDLSKVIATPGPKLMLVPYRSAVGPELAANLEAADVWVFYLDDVVIWDAKNTLGPRYDPHEIFKSIIATLPGALAETPVVPEVNLPVGTQWSEIKMNFDTPDVIEFHGPGVHRMISPADLEMSKQRKAEVKVQWVWLQNLARHNGRMPVGKASAQKQKQFVSDRLRTFTGIDADPIDSENGYYVAKFKLTNSLKQGRADQR